MRKWETEDGFAKAVIIMIHGAMEHHGRYWWVAEMWRSSGFHVLMGDLPGQGLSSRRKRGHIDSFDEYIDEVKTWVQSAAQYEMPIFLLGHSMGGLIAVRLLQEARLPITGVILSSPCLGIHFTPPKMLNFLSYGLNYLLPSLKVSPRLTIEMATRNKEVQKVDMNDTLFLTKVSVRWYRELVHAIDLAFTNISKMPDLPLLIMQGGDDKIVNKEAVKKWFNQLSLTEMHYREWPKLYHEIFSEPEREDVFEYGKDFVEDCLRTLGYLIE
ncbi:lysophospholipase [Oikeobacillus pervagus]|uniref:Lysophospholipase n=1 Tax=Oikeobacillus pervagus TaxID=1325931 RepID=A0AAJ1SZL4_9BACI|nr:alpha/beta hydrolase [Oikeobacillus pervagus]MDQ0215770.1 lysophospholipase [Oikeobacillus pervagus]